MTIEITKPELERMIIERLNQGTFPDAEAVILNALQSSAAAAEAERKEAIERLKTFGQRNGLSLDDATVRELRDQARP
jgi:hypothetical protein